ncbi:uncharacterized protein LOC126326595 [Schistocerca gregaria]|uniref:uncharacterized protein LOC126326595 n=1 Tax=Schistocerca gregaria TaxID=7010 RepID=UPI00211E3178|nr:uncharacterized protein LOC126326595 [Schistocerca gregaria]
MNQGGSGISRMPPPRDSAYSSFHRNDRNGRGYPNSRSYYSDRPYNSTGHHRDHHSGRNGHRHYDGNKKQEVGEDGLLPQDLNVERTLFHSHSNTGINFEKYHEIPVEAFGDDVPPSFQSFSELDLHPVLRNSIQLCGYEVPTPVQQYSLPIIFAKRDLMACAQTGSGKTAAFLFPMIGRILKENLPPAAPGRTAHPLALILAPTRELANQIYDESCKFTYRSHLRSVVVYGGPNMPQQAYELSKGCDILVATPGRLVDMIHRNRVSLSSCHYLCLDEADRMLDMGFESQIRKIVEGSGMPPTRERQTLMFSATFPKEIQQLAQDFLNNYIFLKVGRVGSTTDFITQKILYVEDDDKFDELLRAIESIEGLTLIFVETKRLADYLEAQLYKQGFPSTSIHGDRSQPERESALNSFRTGRTPILVATDIAARGLDISNVAHVINYDMPRDINDYVHRIGRTGRAGNSGSATAFLNLKNRNLIRGLINLLEESNQEVPSFLLTMALESPHQSHSHSDGYGGRGRGGYKSRGGGSNDYRYENESRYDYSGPNHPMAYSRNYNGVDSSSFNYTGSHHCATAGAPGAGRLAVPGGLWFALGFANTPSLLSNGINGGLSPTAQPSGYHARTLIVPLCVTLIHPRPPNTMSVLALDQSPPSFSTTETGLGARPRHDSSVSLSNGGLRTPPSCRLAILCSRGRIRRPICRPVTMPGVSNRNEALPIGSDNRFNVVPGTAETVGFLSVGPRNLSINLLMKVDLPAFALPTTYTSIDPSLQCSIFSAASATPSPDRLSTKHTPTGSTPNFLHSERTQLSTLFKLAPLVPRRVASNVHQKALHTEETPEEALSNLIVFLGDASHSSSSPVSELISKLSETILANCAYLKTTVIEKVMACIVAIPHKVPIYSTLVSLLIRQNSDFKEDFLSTFKTALASSFRELNYYNIKYLSFFISCLYNSNAISSNDLAAYFETLTSLTLCSSSTLTQRISDFYATTVIGSMVLCKTQLTNSRIWQDLKNYVDSRHQLIVPLFRSDSPPLTSTKLLISDFGNVDKDWLRMYYESVMEHALAGWPTLKLPWQPWESPDLQEPLFGTPTSPLPPTLQNVNWFPDSPDETTLRNLLTFKEYFDKKQQARIDHGLPPIDTFQMTPIFRVSSPRPTLRIFPNKDDTSVDLTTLELFVLEDILLDTIHFFRSSISDLPKYILNIPFNPSQLYVVLCEVLFKDLLRSFYSSYPVAHYGSIISTICFHAGPFIPLLAEAVERLFRTLDHMNYPSTFHLAEWFAFHLSNTNFRWSWEDWAESLSNNQNSIQSLFVRETLSQCVQLSYYERIQQSIPPQLLFAIPEKFTEPTLPPNDDPASQELASSLHLHKSIDASMDSIKKVVNLKSPSYLPNVIQSLTHSILLDGGKSITHLQASLDRRKHIYTLLNQEYQPPDQNYHIIKAIFSWYKSSPQHILITLLKFCENGVLEHSSILSFLFDESTLKEYVQSSLLYKTLDKLVSDLILRVSLKEDEITSAVQESKKVLSKDDVLDNPDIKDMINQLSSLRLNLDSLFLSLFDSLSQISSSHLDNSQLSQFAIDYFVHFALKYSAQFYQCLPTLEILLSTKTHAKEKLDYLKAAIYL